MPSATRSSTPSIVTVWASAQFDALKTSVPAETRPSAGSVTESVSVTSEAGGASRRKVTVCDTAPPSSVVVPLAVTVMPGLQSGTARIDTPPVSVADAPSQSTRIDVPTTATDGLRCGPASWRLIRCDSPTGFAEASNCRARTSQLTVGSVVRACQATTKPPSASAATEGLAAMRPASSSADTTPVTKPAVPSATRATTRPSPLIP